MSEERRSAGGEPSGLDGEQNTSAGSWSPARGRWIGRLAILGLILLVFGPLLHLEMPAEIARWYQAAAMEHWFSGDKAAALSRWEDSLRWAPERAEVFVCRGDWWLDEREFEKAIDDYNTALKYDPRHIMARINRSQAFQHLGLHQRAIEDWKQLLEFHRSGLTLQRAVLLNGLAYAQALGNVELEEALENVSEALALVGNNPAMLDTRGYIHHLTGNLDAALADLNPAVAGVEREVRALEQAQQYIHRGEFERRLGEYRHNLAVIRYHRALVFEALNRPKEAEADLRRVEDLGQIPGPHLF